ncbi:hypothetical protein IMSAGC011_00883 [Lachnospiraceae bacterium]|nr:hypothetical protein IMSAGC011_00883 [Lachnospiraceae bacterium]
MYYLKIFVKTFLSLFAIMRVIGMSTKNPCSLILFLILLYVFAKLHSDRVESHIVSGDMTLSVLISFLFSIFTLSATYQTIWGDMTSKLFCVGILLLTGVGLFIVYYYLSIWFLQAASSISLTGSGYSYAWIPYLAALICLLCWLPYFLYEYPGVMTPDSINQYAQVIGAYNLSNHHSIVHTALIGMFYNMGLSIAGNAHTGLALYTIAQMIFMALAAGYVIRTLQKADIIMPVLLITVGFYALMPYNGAYSVTIWKDIPFAGCMTIFCAALMRFLLRGSFAASSDAIPKLRISEYFTLLIPYILSGTLLCLLRTNGWYIFVVSALLILITYHKWLKVMLPIHLTILAFVLFVKYPVMHVYEIPQADFVESLSIPVQQIARVIANGESLTESEAAYVHQLMDLTQIPTAYQPDCSDNIKNLIRQKGSNILELDKGEFFKKWFSIGTKHPKAYFDAYVAQTNGYWYPDINYEVGLADGIYPNEFGLSWQPIIRGNVIIKIKELLFKLPQVIPLYGLLWSMGFLLWLILLIAALSLRMGKPASALVCLPFLLLIVTLCIATPVATEFRYVYAAFYALPLLIVSPFVYYK